MGVVFNAFCAFFGWIGVWGVEGVCEDFEGVYFFELGIFFTLCGAQLIHVNYDIIS